MQDKNSDRVLDLILGQLEKLNENQEKLSEEIQKTNIEITKISGLKHAVSDFKDWKDEISKVANADDLFKIKEFYTKHQDIDADVEDLYLITKELRTDSDDYKKFKTKAMTIITVVSFLLTAAITIIGLLK
jgi:hypothetical protein